LQIFAGKFWKFSKIWEIFVKKLHAARKFWKINWKILENVAKSCKFDRNFTKNAGKSREIPQKSWKILEILHKIGQAGNTFFSKNLTNFQISARDISTSFPI